MNLICHLFSTFIYQHAHSGQCGEMMWCGARRFLTQNTVKKEKEILKILGAKPGTWNSFSAEHSAITMTFLWNGKVWYDVVSCTILYIYLTYVVMYEGPSLSW